MSIQHGRFSDTSLGLLPINGILSSAASAYPPTANTIQEFTTNAFQEAIFQPAPIPLLQSIWHILLYSATPMQQ